MLVSDSQDIFLWTKVKLMRIGFIQVPWRRIQETSPVFPSWTETLIPIILEYTGNLPVDIFQLATSSRRIPQRDSATQLHSDVRCNMELNNSPRKTSYVDSLPHRLSYFIGTLIFANTMPGLNLSQYVQCRGRATTAHAGCSFASKRTPGGSKSSSSKMMGDWMLTSYDPE